jgi:hypothetical protein
MAVSDRLTDNGLQCSLPVRLCYRIGLNEPTETPVPHNVYALMAKAGGSLRAHLTQRSKRDWPASW